MISDVNIRADFVSRFSACYGSRPHGRFSNSTFWATFTFKLIAGLCHKLAFFWPWEKILWRYKSFSHCWLPKEDPQVSLLYKENFQVKITLLPFGCILINKVHWKYSGTQNIWNFVIWRGMNFAKLISVCLYF